MKSNKKLVAVTMGDPSGVSTEIIIKSWKKTANTFFVIHDPDYIKKVANKFKTKVKIKTISRPEEAHEVFKKFLPVLPIKIDKDTKLGKPNHKNSKNIFNSIDLAVKLAKKKEVSGIVTSPISKEVLSKFKKNFSGHTEYLAKSDKKKQFGMMLLNKKLRVVPFTTHVPLKNVHKYIKQKPLFDAIKLLNNSLKKNFGIKKPKIAVTGLNPHSGDGGLLGNEEQKIILPVIKKIKKSGISISGPLSPDSAFQQKNLKFFDAFLCMYHDQALIPVKTIDFENTINYTLGLSFVRTSPDHGTGYDIANKFIANETSLITAINYAAKI
jgi:4-hydroxythreonine-4-phosphate dehydrogenase